MSPLPNRFFSTEEKVEFVGSTYCSACLLTRRTDLTQVNTPGDELGADIWRTSDIFGLSVNLLSCVDHKRLPNCLPDDVNITPIEVKDLPFESDDQVKSFELDKIECKKTDNIIIQMIIEEIESIEGSFPFKKGAPDEVMYNYKLDVKYIPFVLNVFHFQIEVLSDETGRWGPICRKKAKKNYIRCLASIIRARLLDERKVKKLII